MNTFTLIHVIISLVGIFTGLVMLAGWLGGKSAVHWTKWFLVTTVLTSVTGFFFPYHGFTPAIGTGIISLIVLAIALYARHARHLAGGWRKTFVITAVLALYLNVFVLVVQLFQKIPALHQLAPKQNEPPFAVTQLLVLVLFVVLGIRAVMRSRTDNLRTA